MLNIIFCRTDGLLCSLLRVGLVSTAFDLGDSGDPLGGHSWIIQFPIFSFGFWFEI